MEEHEDSELSKTYSSSHNLCNIFSFLLLSVIEDVNSYGSDWSEIPRENGTSLLPWKKKHLRQCVGLKYKFQLNRCTSWVKYMGIQTAQSFSRLWQSMMLNSGAKPRLPREAAHAAHRCCRGACKAAACLFRAPSAHQQTLQRREWDSCLHMPR